MTEILSAYWNLVPVSLAQGAVYAFVALGVMIPFRLLSLPDLTAEGSFPSLAGSAIRPARSQRSSVDLDTPTNFATSDELIRRLPSEAGDSSRQP